VHAACLPVVTEEATTHPATNTLMFSTNEFAMTLLTMTLLTMTLLTMTLLTMTLLTMQQHNDARNDRPTGGCQCLSLTAVQGRPGCELQLPQT
jgi:hypothetical protein